MDIIEIERKARFHVQKISKGKGNNLNWIALLSECNYYNGNVFFDEDIEKSIKLLSSRIIDKRQIMCRPEEKRVVLCDSFSVDNRGLTQQYLSALIDNNYSFLYITRNALIHETEIYHQIDQYPNGKVLLINKKQCAKSVNDIYKAIIDYVPSKVICHLQPWSIDYLIAICALPSFINKYNINLTDHRYWAGTQIFNYIFEFRSHGASLSVIQRHINDEKLLLMPYYPFVGNKEFQGWPKGVDVSKVIVFWGGAFAKVNQFFLELIRDILINNANSVCCCAGTGFPNEVDRLKSFIEESKLSKRWFLLGERDDIYEVVKHIDVFINTYPVGGGLMSQYAANYCKPIISFGDIREKENFIEKQLRLSVQLTYTNRDDFLEHVGLLITDDKARDYEGKLVNEGIMNRVKFSSLFEKTIRSNSTQLPIHIDTNVKESNYLGTSGLKRGKNNGVMILKRFGIKSIIYFPGIILWLIKYLFTIGKFRVYKHE